MGKKGRNGDKRYTTGFVYNRKGDPSFLNNPGSKRIKVCSERTKDGSKYLQE